MINTVAIHRYRAKVQENIDLFMSVAEDAGFPVPRPPVSYKAKMTRAAGTCGMAGITLSVEYLAEFEERQVWHTLGHEFAHWIQRHHNMFTFTARKRIAHNAKFYALCRMLGVNDTRCHDMVLKDVTRRTTKTQSAKCGCQTFKVTTAMLNKIKRGSQYNCKKCKVILTPGVFQEAA